MDSESTVVVAPPNKNTAVGVAFRLASKGILTIIMSFLGALLKPLVYLSVPIIIAAWFTPLGYYYVRLGVYIALLSSVGSASTFIGLAMTLVGRKYDVNNVVAYTFYWITSRMLNITVELEGEEHLQTRPAVMIGNHQSMLDILWLGRYVYFFW